MNHRVNSVGLGTDPTIGSISFASAPTPAASGNTRSVAAPRGLGDQIVRPPIGSLKPFPPNPRRHPEEQIIPRMRSIQRIWTTPILIDETDTILAGRARLAAAERLGLSQVPTVTLAGLDATEKQTVVIADKRLPEQAVWDFDVLRDHFKQLIEIDFEV